MLKSKRFKRIVKSMAVGTLIASTVGYTLYATNSIGMIGSNQALGSPLLNQNFNPENFQEEEVIVFGIFLSNFPAPFIDDYKSTFVSGFGGTSGRGYEALNFDKFNSNDTTLKNLLDHAINIQNSKLQPIYVQSKVYKEDGTVSNGIGCEGEKIPATINDLLEVGNMNGQTTWVGVDGNPRISYGTRVDGAHTFRQAQKYYFVEAPQFYLSSNATGDSRQIILDMFDGYDSNMVLAWASRIATGYSKEITSEIVDNLEVLMDNKSELYFDAFGNIVAKDAINEKFVMVFPACANSNITTSKSYNLVNSLFMGSSYLDVDKQAYTSKLEADRRINAQYYGGTSAISNPAKMFPWSTGNKNFVTPGSILAFFDSDTYVAKHNDNARYGDMFKDVLNAQLDERYAGDVDLRVEVVRDKDKDEFPKPLKNLLDYNNIIRKGITDFKNTLYSIDVLGRKEGGLDLFGKPIMVPVSNPVGQPSNSVGNLSKDNKYFLRRNYIEYINEVYNQNIQTTNDMEYKLPSKQVLDSAFAQCKEVSDFYDYVFGNAFLGFGEMSTMFYNYLHSMGHDVNLNTNPDHYGAVDLNTTDSYYRIIKLLPRNETMRAVADVLGVKPGSNFESWTPNIYATYLEWYGLIGDKNNTLNANLFNVADYKLETNKIATVQMTDEDLKERIATLLDPEAGRALRKQMQLNSVTDFMYDSYNKIVYDTDSTSGRISNSDSSTGFLSINTYTDNPFTSWFISNYSKFVVPVIGIGLLAIIVIALLNRKSIGWFIVSVVALINIVIITPSLGDVIPYLTSRFQNTIFSNRLDFWAISETLQNTRIENSIAVNDDYGEEINNDVYNLVKMFNTSYMDQSLILRWDISKKVTESQIGNLNDIQKYQSTRWMLPQIIRQFTAQDNSASYVYISMAEALDNARYMYWYHVPADMVDQKGMGDTSGGGEHELSGTQKKGLYDNYVDLDLKYSAMTDSYASTSRMKDYPVHTSFYFMPNMDSGSVDLTLKDEELEASVDRNIGMVKSEYINACTLMEQSGGTYNSWEPNTVKNQYGYMWTTESPLTYFYMVVKDSFDIDDTLSDVVTDLQGVYVGSDSGDPTDLVRSNFMYYKNTGNLKDIVDSEELITNLVPYIYTTQITAGGLDGKSGIFNDEKISSYEVYKKNRKSWLFRSNWVTKLMESPELTKSVEMHRGGAKVTIENPMLPKCYPDSSPMVFSKAQMEVQGLTEFDLTIPELKILKMNENIATKWTYLLNYANMKEMTKEVLYKQMALIATTEFNKAFTQSGFSNSELSLYPLSVELRNISFDSIMKMVLLNSTRDVSYVYGDTMFNFISNSDIIGGFALLCLSFVCVNCIPLVNNIHMAVMLFIGMYGVLRNMLSSGVNKSKQSIAYLINSLGFVAMTCTYYLLISSLMGMNSTTDVLSVGNAIIDIKSPTKCIVLMFVYSLAYIYGSYRMIRYTIVTRDDLGASRVEMAFSTIAEKVGKGFNKVASSFSGFSGTFGYSGPTSGGNSGYANNSNIGGYQPEIGEGFNSGGAIYYTDGNSSIQDDAYDTDESNLRANMQEDDYTNIHSGNIQGHNIQKGINDKIEEGKKQLKV